MFFKALVRLFKEGFLVRSAALAYTTLLSLVPFLLLVAYVLSKMPILHEATSLLPQFIVQHFVADSAKVVEVYLNEFIENFMLLPLASLIILLATVVMTLAGATSTFNAIWSSRPVHYRYFRWFLRLMILLIAPVLLTSAMILSARMTPYTLLAQNIVTSVIPHFLVQCSFYLINIICFALINIILPNVQVPWRSAIISGVVTTALFVLAQWGFAFYINHFSMYNEIYGALSVIPVFLIWIYLSWLMIIFGALCGSGWALKFK